MAKMAGIESIANITSKAAMATRQSTRLDALAGVTLRTSFMTRVCSGSISSSPCFQTPYAVKASSAPRT